MSRSPVVVVGAGIMGSATAWALAESGVPAVVVEQFGPEHDRGSSHGRSRIFRLAYPDPAYVRMAAEALPLWQRVQDESGRRLLDPTGALDFGDPASVGEVAATLAAEGIRHEMLSAAEADERWPGFRLETDVLHQPDGGRLRARHCLLAFREQAEERGVELRFGDGVEAITPSGDGVEVATASGTIRASSVVVTAGAWLPSLLGGTVPLPDLTVTRESVFHFTPRVDRGEMMPFIDHRSPFMYGLHSPGEGTKVAEHHAGPQVDPDSDGPVDPAARDRVVDYVKKWLPGLDPSPHHEQACLYTSTPDHSFVIERHGPIVVGSPCSGHGFKFAPVIGRRLAALAVEG